MDTKHYIKNDLRIREVFCKTVEKSVENKIKIIDAKKVKPQKVGIFKRGVVGKEGGWN